MIQTNTQMTLDYFNDFYVLEAIKAGIAMNQTPELAFSHRVEKLVSDIAEYEERFIANIASRTFMYIWAAAVGEARHSRESLAETHYIEELRESDRANVFSNITNFPPTPGNVQAICDVFNQNWGGSYGGAAWLNIAKAAKMFFEVPASVFLDHVIDLQHNNGTVFSKDEAQYLQFKLKYDPGSQYFNRFLDYKFKHDILKQNPGWNMLVTRKTFEFVTRFCNIFGREAPKHIEPRLRHLDKYEVQWGETKLTLVKKWRPWAVCKKGNLPNIQQLVRSEKNEIWPAAYTQEKFLAAVKIASKKINAMLKDSFGNKYKKEVEKLFDEYYNEHVHKCKAPKKDVTYVVLPFKMKRVEETLTLQFPYPYNGVGKQTDYGFVLETKYHQGIYDGGNELGYDGEPGFTSGYCKLDSDNQVVLYTIEHTWYLNNKEMESILQ